MGFGYVLPGCIRKQYPFSVQSRQAEWQSFYQYQDFNFWVKFRFPTEFSPVVLIGC